jgi:membrane associated rhomboid family serine protease
MTRRSVFPAFAAPLTAIIFAVDVVLYLVCATRSGNFMDFDGRVLMSLGASYREGLWNNEWLRLIAPIFLHGGLIHIAVNLISLRALGPATEQYFGSTAFGTIYLLSGITGFCFSQLFGGGLAVGASASLFGMLGAGLLALVIDAPTWKGAWHHPGVRQYLFWIGLNFVLGLSIPNIDNWGHLGGFLSGALLGALFDLERRRKPVARVGLLATLLLIASLIALARWTVYSPYYHIYCGARAAEIDHDQPAADAQFAEALKWSKVWKQEPITQARIAAYQAHNWEYKDAQTDGLFGVDNGVREWFYEMMAREHERAAEAQPPAGPPGTRNPEP